MLRLSHRFFVGVLASIAVSASAQESLPKLQEFAPKAGKGRAVVLISGQTGFAGYTTAAQQIAESGFSVVLVDGNDLWIKDARRAWNMVKEVIHHAQSSPHALPGKIGVVAYSLGGAAAITYAARMPETVATVVAAYPLTAFIKDPSDFVSKIRVPVQLFAGTADTYKDCCRIELARQLADSAKSASPPMLTLHEYEGAGHGFNLPTATRKDQAFGEDAMERTVSRLRQALPVEEGK